jgi:hypothetical protein
MNEELRATSLELEVKNFCPPTVLAAHSIIAAKIK